MSIRTHFCVVQCCSIWNPDPHHGFVDASLFSAIWHALGGKRGLERPGLDVAVTALTGGELTVGDEFWARHGGIGVTSDAFLQALITCKDRVCGPEFRWLPQAPPQSVAEAHAWLLNSVAHYAERLESDARRSLRMESGHPDVSEDTLPQFRSRCHHTLQCLSSQVSNGNLRRAAGGLARCPLRRSRSPRRNFTVDVSDSDDEFGLPYGRLSPSSSDTVHLRRPYTKRAGSNE